MIEIDEFDEENKVYLMEEIIVEEKDLSNEANLNNESK